MRDLRRQVQAKLTTGGRSNATLFRELNAFGSGSHISEEDLRRALCRDGMRIEPGDLMEALQVRCIRQYDNTAEFGVVLE